MTPLLTDYWTCPFCRAFNNSVSFCVNCGKGRGEKVARVSGVRVGVI